MRAVIQRVRSAQVAVEGQTTGRIERGLLVFLGIGKGDTESDAEWMVRKIVNLRVFPDSEGKMNRSVLDIQGGILLVSQFTLYGNCRKGTRPSFDEAADPETARELYAIAVELICKEKIEVATGVFAAHMDITAEHDGPVTIGLDSR
ncbi:MAG: D-tyrosyl-tRNA(Tyr) deacylase [Phycisphaerae bacterium]|nr:D-tyrosyl-tRNA(Tyr) deacylase [Phycisphaerae bacterium]